MIKRWIIGLFNTTDWRMCMSVLLHTFVTLVNCVAVTDTNASRASATSPSESLKRTIKKKSSTMIIYSKPFTKITSIPCEKVRSRMQKTNACKISKIKYYWKIERDGGEFVVMWLASRMPSMLWSPLASFSAHVCMPWPLTPLHPFPLAMRACVRPHTFVCACVSVTLQGECFCNQLVC